jgi:hypothetical protein
MAASITIDFPSIADDGPQIVIHARMGPEDNSIAGRAETMARTGIVFEYELVKRPGLTYAEQVLIEFRDVGERPWPRPGVDHNIRVEASRIFVDREEGLLEVVMNQVLKTAGAPEWVDRADDNVERVRARLAHVIFTLSLIEIPRHKTAWQHILEDEVPCPKP